MLMFTVIVCLFVFCLFFFVTSVVELSFHIVVFSFSCDSEKKKKMLRFIISNRKKHLKFLSFFFFFFMYVYTNRVSCLLAFLLNGVCIKLFHVLLFMGMLFFVLFCFFFFVCLFVFRCH